MTHAVLVRTGARLHFGLLAVNPTCGRRFGGVGVMIDEPSFSLTFRRAERDEIAGATDATAGRIREFLTRLRAANSGTGTEAQIRVHSELPSHAGLGSGTQLGLAVAAGLRALGGKDRCSAVELAPLVGRGARSAIGVHGFDHGGFLIESGRGVSDAISPLAVRADVSADWRWLLVTPPQAMGLSGSQEQQAFVRLPPMPESTTATLCRLLLMEWLPAILGRDFPVASAAMWNYGQAVGQYFAQIQGGVFADQRMHDLAAEVRRIGPQGVAQTSWGPTVAVLCRDPDEAESLQRRLTANPRWCDLQFLAVATRNVGAEVSTLAGVSR